MKPNQHLQSLTLALCVTLSALAFAQAQDKPGIMLGDTVFITATIEAINQKDRAVALRGPAGNVFVVEVGDEVKNFKQIKVGDQVRVEYYEAVAVYFGNAGEHPAEDAAAIVATAPKGQKPGGMADPYEGKCASAHRREVMQRTDGIWIGRIASPNGRCTHTN